MLWADMPNPKIIFHSDGRAVIPFSLVPGIPFLLAGNYVLWGRFVADARLKRRTYYAITNRRVLFLERGWKTKTASMFLREISMIEAEGTATGSLWLGPKYPVIARRGQKKRNLSRFEFGDVPSLADIDNVDSVHRLLLDLRARHQRSPSSPGPLSYAG